MAASRPKISLKRAYHPAEKSDGFRILVDRLWPCGLKKEDAQIDAWVREVAPSNELRKWFHAHSDNWSEFRTRYPKELKSSTERAAISEIRELLAKHQQVTFLFSSKETEQNNAVVLREYLEAGSK